MCQLCDGMDPGVLMLQTRDRIERFGFTVMAIEASSPWAYTIGLVEKFEHPELVITGLSTQSSYDALSAAAEHVRLGERYERVGERFDLHGATVRVGAIHTEQWRHGRFNGWLEFYDWEMRSPLRRALQLIVDDPKHRCSLPRGECQPLLDTDPQHDVNRMNRAERRRAERERRGLN